MTEFKKTTTFLETDFISLQPEIAIDHGF